MGDSSDREPRAARQFMLRFSELLDHIAILSTRGSIPEDRLEPLMAEIVDRSRQILRESLSKGTTTFTGILFVASGHATKALLFHTGDSVLLAFHPLHGLRQISEKNFWLIGKTREFYQVAILDVAPGERYLLATDGLHDLMAPGGTHLNDCIAEVFTRYPVHDVPDRLIGSCDTKTEARDDLALLAETIGAKEALEKAAILKTLDDTRGNKSEAARRLGITRRTLHLKLKKYGLM